MSSRILAVDDEIDVLLIVKTALQSENYQVLTATNGPDAINICREQPPDLILLDVKMAGMSGFDVMRELKSDDRTSTIPIIMLTGLSERKKIQEALMKGSDYYIVKPFEMHELLAKISDVLAHHGR